jgi:hypothetical protein
MPSKEARYWMKQCVDSGLWVPSPESARLFSDDTADDDDDESEIAPAKSSSSA